MNRCLWIFHLENSMRSFKPTLAFVLLLIPIAFAQDQLSAEATKARALDVLKQAREALGGEATLASIKSLQVQGGFKGMRFNRPTQGDFKIEVLMPDKFMREVRSAMGPLELTMIQTVNSADTWLDMKQSMAMTGGGMGGDASGTGGGAGEGGFGGAGGGAGGGRGGGGGGGRGGGRGGMGGGSDMPRGPTGGGLRGISPEMEDLMKRETRGDFARFLIAVLLQAPDSRYEFSYDRQMDAKEGKVDVLKVFGPDEFASLLVIDQKTHRPSVMAYRAPAARGPSNPRNSPTIVDEAPEGPKLVDYQLFFSEHKQFGNVWFPQRIVKSANGQMVEEWRLNKYKINPDIKPNRFEKKKG